MDNRSLRVLVVDDDFMIAKLHGKFIDSQIGYKLVGTAHSYEEALSCMDKHEPDLLLLDIYLPDRSGLELLHTIRLQNRRCDVLLITAAKELETVEMGFRFGVIDYLIKPFNFSQLQAALIKYSKFKSRLSAYSEVDQGTLDDLKKLRISESSLPINPKGIDIRTLEKIKICILDSANPLSADQIAKLAGVSLSTTRTYLTHLVDEQILIEEQKYGTVGRPLRLYRIAN
ncbi:response regulator [Neobacillus sp. PS3-12]|jgi:response regulator of citrate/malate metabolism|uniref:response regulator n=1 Tax=Neobacillus sp. PS3-12 TaxID=3070677 RepID=UPI0027DF64CF|nr:response regulator [Neobacillus sp. PS3-12]WML54504.1 response regulator [Neobacillus sp. PS3-12]